MTSIQIINGVGPTSLEQLVPPVKPWDALLAYQAASKDPLSLGERVALAQAAPFGMPTNMPQPWNKQGPVAQAESLAKFNAVVDALAGLAARPGFADKAKPADFRVLDTFAFTTPVPGFFVHLLGPQGDVKVPVYRR